MTDEPFALSAPLRDIIRSHESGCGDPDCCPGISPPWLEVIEEAADVLDALSEGPWGMEVRQSIINRNALLNEQLTECSADRLELRRIDDGRRKRIKTLEATIAQLQRQNTTLREQLRDGFTNTAISNVRKQLVAIVAELDHEITGD